MKWKKEINKQNQKKKPTFAKTYVTKDSVFCEKIVFSSKSKFNIFNLHEWGRANTELRVENAHPAIKFIVWIDIDKFRQDFYMKLAKDFCLFKEFYQ